MAIDLERCRRGMKQLRVEGFARNALIEEAIAAIQKDPIEALKTRYFGIKNYAGFGDQREDHEYGYSPKHGSIVFSIGRNEFKGALDADAIYYLEAYRDFETMAWQEYEHGRLETRPITLSKAIREFDELTRKRNLIADAFEKMRIETHA